MRRVIGSLSLCAASAEPPKPVATIVSAVHNPTSDILEDLGLKKDK